MNNITTLVRQIESTYQRLSHLCLQANDSTTSTLEILPQALKELGPTAEALQMVTKTLQQQSDQDDPHVQFGCNSQAQLITNLEGKIQAVNSATAQLLRVSASDLIGQYLSRFVAIDQRHSFHLELKQLQQSAQPQEWISYLQPRRGRLLELVLSITPVASSDNHPVQIHWTLQNAAALRALLLESALKHEQDNQSKPFANSTAEMKGFSAYYYEVGDVIPLSLQTIGTCIKALSALAR